MRDVTSGQSNQLCVRYNNTTYHAVDVTPVVTIHYDAFSLFAQTTVSATLNVAIGNPINIMGYADAEGSGNSVIIATISAGSKTASGSTFLINYRYLGIRIGSWKNITSTPASTSGGSVTLNIDNETYWGV